MEISKSKTLEADHDDHKSSEEPEFGLSLEKLNLGPKKKLLIMNLNGFLLHRAHVCDKKAIPKSRTADYKYPYFLLFKRPFSEEFIKFCLERFEVGLWSSAMEHNIDDALACAIGELKNKLLFVWDQDKCRDSGFKSLENNQKPLFFKELKEVWHSVKKGGPYSASNTLLIDDKPYKSLLNPPNTSIFTEPYDPVDKCDKALDPNGDLCKYLKGLAEAEDVQSYVKDNAFGVPAITTSHPDWGFYSRFRRSIE
ncbi:putative FCP1 domain, HAD-like domain-containing protein [Medicago truncatula]|uniref:Mitochondrial import inner membrane translocase subunit TIM50 n=1 Tax=Medicago truncatula TaxID=3880 RepID=A0A072U309_MEDTR|nr:NLI interacting factor-like phosphatase [Medicago truncatula]RHN48617.1 putative FCP1 domain, HAD-like domain-containing protein [Medicago truncatula]